MSDFSMDEGDFALDELIDAIDGLGTELRHQMAIAAIDIKERIAGDARRNAPSDTGDLRSSITGVVETLEATMLELRVGTNRDGAAAQEFGTDPGHFPPPSELRDWCRRVLGDPDAAFVVARSISETGLDEQRYLRDAFEDNIEWTLDRIDQAVMDALAAVGFDT